MTNSSAQPALSSKVGVVAQHIGGPDVLTRTVLPLPPLEPGQLGVEVHYAAVNFWDVMQRRGSVPLPADSIPGVEGVGVVIAAGSPEDSPLVGSRVAWSKIPSSYSTQVIGPREYFLPIPSDLDDTIAAALLMQGVTAQYLAESTTNLVGGDIALVTSIAGGVGSLLTQFLNQRGVTVIGTVSSSEKVERASGLGATLIIDSPDLVAHVRDIAPEGVHAVFDASGGDIARLFSMLRRRGICVIYGSASGTSELIDPGALSAGSFYLTRTAGRDYAVTYDEWRMRADDVFRRAVDGRLKPLATQILPMSEAVRAHELLESRVTVGKLLLDART